MKIKLKPKTFGPVAIHVDSEGNLQDGLENPPIDRQNISAMSPAFLQLFSLGACIAISLGMAAKQMGLSLNAFSVFVTSKKAEDLPSRFGGFSVIVSKNIFIDKQIAINLINKAKTICTVSNSLNAEVLIYLSDEA